MKVNFKQLKMINNFYLTDTKIQIISKTQKKTNKIKIQTKIKIKIKIKVKNKIIIRKFSVILKIK